jgi:hypothetical protein
MKCKGFESYPRNELLVARGNLAETTVALLMNAESLSGERLVHVVGNFVLATAATTDTDHQLPEGLADALASAGGSQDWARSVARKLASNDWQRLIFPLLHIPNDAPELILGPRSRELDVAVFTREARALRPEAQPDQAITGFGNPIFIGMYLRSLG